MQKPPPTATADMPRQYPTVGEIGPGPICLRVVATKEELRLQFHTLSTMREFVVARHSALVALQHTPALQQVQLEIRNSASEYELIHIDYGQCHQLTYIERRCSDTETRVWPETDSLHGPAEQQTNQPQSLMANDPPQVPDIYATARQLLRSPKEQVCLSRKDTALLMRFVETLKND